MQKQEQTRLTQVATLFSSELKPDRDGNCQQHGAFTSRNVFSNVWTGCPDCAKAEKTAALQEQEAREKAERTQRWEQRLGQSGIPRRFQDRSLASYVAETAEQRQALSFAMGYADAFRGHVPAKCAVFLGPVGTGKTHLACGIALRIMARYGCSALFTTAAAMARRVREAKGFGAKETESQAIGVFTFPDLLILDEIGIQSGTDAEARTIFDVLDGRYQEQKPTILLSNLDLDGVRACLGERVFDRLREDAGEVLVFSGESWRGRAM